MKPDKKRKCIICSRELGHYKKRFCGGSCYQYYKKGKGSHLLPSETRKKNNVLRAFWAPAETPGGGG